MSDNCFSLESQSDWKWIWFLFSEIWGRVSPLYHYPLHDYQEEYLTYKKTLGDNHYMERVDTGVAKGELVDTARLHYGTGEKEDDCDVTWHKFVETGLR